MCSDIKNKYMRFRKRKNTQTCMCLIYPNIVYTMCSNVNNKYLLGLGKGKILTCMSLISSNIVDGCVVI